MQMVHRLDGEEHGELLARLILGHGEPQLELARPGNHVLDDLVDRVLVDAGPLRDGAARRAADAADELRGGGIARELGCVGEEPPQVAVVEVRIIDAVVAALDAVMLAQRLAQPRAAGRSLPDYRGAVAARAPTASARPCIPASFRPAIPYSAAASRCSASARPQTFRRSPHRDGSARTTRRDAARSSCCRGAAYTTRDTVSCRSRRPGGAAGGAAA